MLRWTGQTKPPFVKVVALNLHHPRRPIFAAGSVERDFHLNFIVEKALSEILSPVCELYFIIEKFASQCTVM